MAQGASTQSIPNSYSTREVSNCDCKIWINRTGTDALWKSPWLPSGEQWLSLFKTKWWNLQSEVWDITLFQLSWNRNYCHQSCWNSGHPIAWENVLYFVKRSLARRYRCQHCWSFTGKTRLHTNGLYGNIALQRRMKWIWIRSGMSLPSCWHSWSWVIRRLFTLTNLGMNERSAQVTQVSEETGVTYLLYQKPVSYTHLTLPTTPYV